MARIFVLCFQQLRYRSSISLAGDQWCHHFRVQKRFDEGPENSCTMVTLVVLLRFPGSQMGIVGSGEFSSFLFFFTWLERPPE